MNQQLARCSTYIVGFDRQLFLADRIGDLPWAYDLETGKLSFGARFVWQAEILGTESEETGTWLWAWANEGSDIPQQQQGGRVALATCCQCPILELRFQCIKNTGGQAASGTRRLFSC